MDFPVYRKKFDGRSFYKISSDVLFQEVQLIGNRFFIYNIEATKYFEKLQIITMIAADNELHDVCSKEDYDLIYRKAEQYLIENK